MSRFDYNQYHIDEIADTIQLELDRMGKEIPKEDRWGSEEWYENHPESLIYETYSEETIKEFHNAIRYLRIAKIYTQRIDYLLSGDDGEDTFHERLNEELNNKDDGDR